MKRNQSNERSWKYYKRIYPYVMKESERIRGLIQHTMKQEFNLQRTDFQIPNPEMETEQMKKRRADLQVRLQQLNETACMIPDSQSDLFLEYLSGVHLLKQIFEVLPAESKGYPDDSATSFDDVEKEIARCISVCLRDVPSRKRCIDGIQSLLRGQRVVVPVRGQNPTTSLHRVHVILQDNFPGSCLCKLLNILLAGFMNTQTKVITF